LGITRRRVIAKRLHGALALLVVLCLAGSAAAQDAVKLSGFWIEPVTVESIRDGQVRYQTGQGVDMTRSIHALEGLRLGRYPELGQAMDALDRGDDLAATALLKRVDERAHEPWLKGYVGMRRVGALSRLDEAEAAAGLYVDRVVSGVDLVFVADPPVDVVAGADVAVRLRISKLAKAATGAVDDDRASLLQALIDAAGNPSPELITADTGGPEIGGGAGPALSASVPPGTVVNLYTSGRYEQALLAADEALSRPGKTASKLYLKGMAQLALAERASDADGYKSAGLSFMRVVVYYPRSSVAGPAWLEAGYVHQVLGRTDIAARLYRRAQSLIHEDEDPACFVRLSKLNTEVDDTSADD
jgi:hypothetical protein